MKIVCQNRKARHDFAIDSSFEAGMVLRGSEVKSLRAGKVNLNDGYVAVHQGEVFVHNLHISPYEQAGEHYNHDPLRTRKLLLKADEINKLTGQIQQRGFTCIPLKIYFKNGRAKIEIALAKGKRKHDKREKIKATTDRKEMRRIKQEHQ